MMFMTYMYEEMGLITDMDVYNVYRCTVISAYKELIGTMKICFLFITGVPYKSLVNEFIA